MLPKAGLFRPKPSRPGRTGSSRTIGAAYTGATPFRQSGRTLAVGASELLRNGAIDNQYINVCGVFPCEDGGSRSKLATADLGNCSVALLRYFRVRVRALCD